MIETLKGYSGYSVYKVRNAVVKETDGDPKRLLHQAHKQMKYKRRLEKSKLCNTFGVPHVLVTYKNGFSMECVEGKNIIQLMIDEPERIPYIIDNIKQLIDWEFRNSVKRPFMPRYMINKLSPSCPYKIAKYIDDEAMALRYKLIPVGINHGDLSLSNMIFTDSKIYLIDFLKTYYRSPYQDIGKLWQEYDLKWSLKMFQYVNFKAIDDGYAQIYEYLLKKLPYNRMIRLFRLMTLARLFPYTSDKNMFKEIEKKCYEVMNE